jgi:hypothetical protein
LSAMGRRGLREKAKTDEENNPAHGMIHLPAPPSHPANGYPGPARRVRVLLDIDLVDTNHAPPRPAS